MTINLDNVLASHPGWLEMVEHANRLLSEWGLEDYELVIRQATSVEQEKMATDDNSILATFDAGERHLELAIGPDPVLGGYEMDEDPEFYAEVQVVGILDEFIEAYEDD
jgi:hypothetical protein